MQRFKDYNADAAIAFGRVFYICTLLWAAFDRKCFAATEPVGLGTAGGGAAAAAVPTGGAFVSTCTSLSFTSLETLDIS